MEPALNMLQSALQGDVEARSLLERTTSTYILDFQNEGKPKTYGCWNFIHQAMNEVERYETRFIKEHQTYQFPPDFSLVAHARLLTSMAVTVARRSPARDTQLVAECLADAAQWNGSQEEVKWIQDVNFELREIVMGRIAAMAFDFSFHRKDGPNGYSAFADRLVMNNFSAILSANAVSSGPSSIKFFVTQWVIPSAQNIPAFSLASVVYSLGIEAMRKSAPAGTKNLLQQLSSRIISFILAPTLVDAVQENSSTSAGMSSHKESSEVAAMCLSAIKVWCQATELSIPQIKHVCSKMGINIIGIFNDAMYSDSPEVIDALAELFEHSVQNHSRNSVSLERIDQVKYIIDVDEALFNQVFSVDQFKLIENREFAVIAGELVSAIGLQRFRYSERQALGADDVCRNLTRIAVCVCKAFMQTTEDQCPEHGVIDILVRAASSSSFGTAGMAIETLVSLMKVSSGISLEVMSVLHRSAVIPDGSLLGDHESPSFDNLVSFRDEILTPALRVCWQIDPSNYAQACMLVIDSPVEPNVQDSEAALFCIEAVSEEILSRQQDQLQHVKFLGDILCKRIDRFLQNELIQYRFLSVLKTYMNILTPGDEDDAVGNTIMMALRKVVGSFRSDPHEGVFAESVHSPLVQAGNCLRALVERNVRYFDNRTTFDELWSIWQMLEEPVVEKVAFETRIRMSESLCMIIASTGEQEQRLSSLKYVVQQSIDSCEKQLKDLNHSDSASEAGSKIASEVAVIAASSRAFADHYNTGSNMNSGCVTSSSRQPIPNSICDMIRGRFKLFIQVAKLGEKEEDCIESIGSLIEEFLPTSCLDDDSLSRTKALMAGLDALSITLPRNLRTLETICGVLERYICNHGEVLEHLVRGEHSSGQASECGQIFEEYLVNTLLTCANRLGVAWNSPREQRNGEPAYERKSPPRAPGNSVSTDFLPRTLGLIDLCVRRCPCMMLKLGSHLDTEGDPLVRRAVDSAVSVLQENNAELVRPAISFLKSVLQYADCSHEGLRSFVLETGSRVRPGAIDFLVRGFCGNFEASLLGDATELLSLFLRTTPAEDLESICGHSLQNQYFFLGDQMRMVVLQMLVRCGRGEPIYNDFASFLQGFWDAHNAEDVTSLPDSDVVARMIRSYQTTLSG